MIDQTNQPARILIVDDEEDLRDVLMYQLRPLNAKVETAENGRKALEMAKRNWYDAILSDINMPEMTGLEFLSALRKCGIDSPFVILTGHGDKAKALEALRLGAFDFLDKPWTADNLRRIMEGASEMGLRLRNLEAEIEKSIESVENLSPEQRHQLKEAQRSLILMRIQRHLISKKAA